MQKPCEAMQELREALEQSQSCGFSEASLRIPSHVNVIVSAAGTLPGVPDAQPQSLTNFLGRFQGGWRQRRLRSCLHDGLARDCGDGSGKCGNLSGNACGGNSKGNSIASGSSSKAAPCHPHPHHQHRLCSSRGRFRGYHHK